MATSVDSQQSVTSFSSHHACTACASTNEPYSISRPEQCHQGQFLAQKQRDIVEAISDYMCEVPRHECQLRIGRLHCGTARGEMCRRRTSSADAVMMASSSLLHPPVTRGFIQCMLYNTAATYPFDI
ncbi:hypothetical protein DOTSEDRAFT_69853 [Dothistroma septosporum NZE10]|uniref:Uncharacterized protein n=1 Tax=Dothistroma septosporum (strain NZE10 / CBS 128990) TaxID=675120 RepID=N1PXB2_DOTSN|nr:hypothetical protein DOTSEDRAFT_69853 [Dothistroma septosporum NZE10]